MRLSLRCSAGHAGHAGTSNWTALADSEEYWNEDHTFLSVCACEEEAFHIAVGFSLYADNMDIRSLAIATMCLACGKLGILSEWMVRHNDMTLLDRS